ncbi:MAG: hypothetical protein U0103_23230 [Candidatus Obscuribacterales bacterium]
MKKSSKLVVATLSATSSLLVSQAGFSQGTPRSSDLQLGLYRAVCCGGQTSANAQLVQIPGHGMAAELQVTGSSECCRTFAETKVEGITFDPGVPIKKAIQFTVTGPGLKPADMTNFLVHVDFLPPGYQPVDYLTHDFTVANGGLKRIGNNQFILTTSTDLMPPGSLLYAVDFDLYGNCSSSQQTVFVQNVLVDKKFCSYDLNAAAAFCGGGN